MAWIRGGEDKGVCGEFYLSGTLAHLTALAAQATHTLLAPLGTHATIHIHHQLDGIGLTHTALGEGA